MDLQEKALKLEKLRRKIEDCTYQIGRIGDIVERFHPPEDQFPELQNLEKYHSDKKIKSEELKKQVKQYLKKEPKVIDAWINMHKKTCDFIIEKKDCERDYRIRKDLAEETIAKLKEIKDGRRENFTINNFYLDDYYKIFKNEGLD